MSWTEYRRADEIGPCERCGMQIGTSTGWGSPGRLCSECLVRESQVAAIQQKRHQFIANLIAVLALVATVIFGLLSLPKDADGDPQSEDPRARPGTTHDRTDTMGSTSAQIPNLGNGNSAPGLPDELTEPNKGSDAEATTKLPSVLPLPIDGSAAHSGELMTETQPDVNSNLPIPGQPTKEVEMSPGEVHIEPAPVDPPAGAFSTTATVNAFASRAEPKVRLRAPSIPSMKPFMARRCIVLRVSVDPAGDATPVVISDGGLAPFFVERAKQGVQVPWEPATSPTGEPVGDIKIVRFCW